MNLQRNTKNSRTKRAALLAGLFSASTALSQDNVVELDAFTVVAASGIEENLSTIPQTIDMVSTLKSAEAQPTWIGELMNKLPGVYFAQLRGPTDAPSIRVPVSYDNTELYLQDGLPIQSPISFNHGAFANTGALTSFGGMEVLKGPGTALHGSDAFAGVINVKSLPPTDVYSGNFRAAVGDFGLTEVRGEVSNGFAENQAFRIAASYVEDDSWRDHSGWDRTQVIARHRWQGDATEVNTTLSYTDFFSLMSSGVSYETYLSDPDNNGLSPLVPLDQAVNPAKHFLLGTEITHEFNPRYTLQVTPWLRRTKSSFMHVWEPAVVPITYSDTETAGLISRLYADWSEKSQTVFGLDLDSTTLDQVDEQVVPTQVVWGAVYPQGKHYDFTVDYSNIAPYFQHTQSLGEQLTLVAGLRYENASYDYANHLSSGVHDAFYRPADRKDTFEALNPKLGLTWEFQPNQSLFARYAHGFRIPSAGSLYTLDSSQTSFELDPEQIDSFELGYRGTIGDSVRFNLASYYMKSYDGLTTGVGTTAGIITANGGEREYQGVEGQIAARISEEWSLNLSAALQDSTILQDRPDGSDPRGVNGKTPNSQPSRLANLGLTWTPAFADRRLTMEFETQLLGSWWIDDENTQKTPDEIYCNLRARYKFDSGWTFTAKALNLFDQLYASTAADSGYGPSYRAGTPFTLSSGLEYAW